MLELRTDKPEPLTFHELHYWKRSESWTWIDGKERWWEVFIEPFGFNGAGGLWLHEHWRWNGSRNSIRVETRSLSLDETTKLIEEILGIRPDPQPKEDTK